MHAYAIQNSEGMIIKLDAMENPYSLPADLQIKLGNRLAKLAVNRYPCANVELLKQRLCDYVKIPAGFDMMMGNGSDELISLLTVACDLPDASVLAPVPSFVMYAVSAHLQGLNFHGVDLASDFSLNEAAMIHAIRLHRPAILYLAYPNNPTANLWDDDVIKNLIDEQEALGGIVVIDEAYQPFSSRSYLDHIQKYNHVLLIRTLSKFGLAGARIGYLIGPENIVKEINKVRPPYNISTLNAECALFALDHCDVFEEQARLICSERDRLIKIFKTWTNVHVYPSDANMILIRVPDALQSFNFLKTQGILVKNVSTMHSLLNNCLRLTVGTPHENEILLSTLKTAIC
jgi:histidinol-phosphate aminotransferase